MVADLCSRHPRLFLGLLVSLVFIPFIDKAFHIDDPLFVWTAKHIWKAPFDFYGFDINWYGFDASISTIAKNPPLFSYYLAVWAVPFGWSEVSLHLACLVCALGLVIGVYELAKLLDARPMVSALFVLSAPVFIVSGTTVMCDMLMVSLWVWAVYFWLKGCRERRASVVVLGAFFILLSALTKYFAVSLLPLLMVYSLWARVSWRYWRLGVLLVIVGLLGYQFGTQILYGKGLITDAADYVRMAKSHTGNQLLVGIAFSGVACAPVFVALLAHRLAKVRWAALLFFILAASGAFIFAESTGLVQLGMWVVLGLVGVTVAIEGVLRRGCAPESVLLCLWILGTLVFTIFLNWTVSARNVLPIVPAAALLAGLSWRADAPQWGRMTAGVFGVAFGVMGLLVARADYCWANGIRSAIGRIDRYTLEAKGRRWFQGHWGGQYYFEQAGWAPFAYESALMPGDHVAIPAIATNIVPPDEGTYISIGYAPIDGLPSVSLMGAGAGFYSSRWGDAPFVLGRGQFDRYVLLKLK